MSIYLHELQIFHVLYMQVIYAIMKRKNEIELGFNKEYVFIIEKIRKALINIKTMYKDSNYMCLLLYKMIVNFYSTKIYNSNEIKSLTYNTEIYRMTNRWRSGYLAFILS